MEQKTTAEISLIGSCRANYHYVVIKDRKLVYSEPIMSKQYPSINAAFTLYEFGKGQQIDPVNIGDIQKWVNWHSVVGDIRYYKIAEGYKVEAYYIDEDCSNFTILHFDEQGLLHNENGPAVVIEDMGGELSIYAVHGEYMPKKFNRYTDQCIGKVSLNPDIDTLVKSSEFITPENYEGPAYFYILDNSPLVLTIDGVICIN